MPSVLSCLCLGERQIDIDFLKQPISMVTVRIAISKPEIVGIQCVFTKLKWTDYAVAAGIISVLAAMALGVAGRFFVEKPLIRSMRYWTSRR